MEAAHFIYSSANQPGSYDSWDIENLKYLRSLSEINGNGKLGGGNSCKSGKSSIRSRSKLSVINLLESLELEKDSEEINIKNHKPVHPVEYSETDSTKTVTLDTCYVLDVVTVRNDSVLANPIPKVRPLGHGLTISTGTGLHNISSGGSDGNEYETPVTDSSEGEGLSPRFREDKINSGNDNHDDTDTTQRDDFFEEEYLNRFHNVLESPQESESRETSPTSSSKSSIISVPYLFPFPVVGSVRSRSRSTSTNSCPYCGDQSSSNESRLSMSSIGINYYKSNPNNYSALTPNGTFDEMDEISMIPTVGGEMTPFMSRNYSTSSSPYYDDGGRMQSESPNAQKQQDQQQLPNVPNANPFTNSPSNFGIDHQGQLFIDYSPNWDGLDKYIAEIKKSESSA